MVKHAVKVYTLKWAKKEKMNGKCRWHPYQNYANFKNLKGNPRKKYVLSDKKKKCKDYMEDFQMHFLVPADNNIESVRNIWM